MNCIHFVHSQTFVGTFAPHRPVFASSRSNACAYTLPPANSCLDCPYLASLYPQPRRLASAPASTSADDSQHWDGELSPLSWPTALHCQYQHFEVELEERVAPLQNVETYAQRFFYQRNLNWDLLALDLSFDGTRDKQHLLRVFAIVRTLDATFISPISQLVAKLLIARLQ